MDRRYLLVLCVALLAPSCKHKLEGEKSPSVQNADLTYCGAEEQSFVVRGAALSPMVVEGATKDASIRLPDVCLTRTEDAAGAPVSGEDETCIPPEDVQWVSQSEVRFTTRQRLGLAPGRYDVVIRNPDGTEAKGNVTLLVLAEGPQVFWSDPNVAYNGISTQVTLYGSLLADVQSVALRDQDRELTELEFEEIGDPARQNRVLATVPSGTPPTQDGYDVVVTTANGCQAELLGGLRVTDTVDLTLTTVDPMFGWSDQATPVTITGAEFQAVPRAYLNPENPGLDTVASALGSVAVVSDTRLTGVVPTGLLAGGYQLIVVNPDGRVGLLDATFSIVDEPPPVIANVSPNYLDNSGDQQVTIEGSDFRTPAVSLACRAPDGADTELEGTVAADAAGSSFQATLPVGTLVQGTVCVVKVTNSDGSYFEYSAVGISNPASNLNDFIDAPAMAVARRAPAVVAGRATRAARFIYAIGGDDGSVAGALSSVESTPIDIYGEPAEWFTQPVALPGARTLSGVARIGRFLYLVGGNDGSGPTASVLRAEVLDPLAAPEIVDITARSGEGLGDGDWYYRISAVMDDADASNPGGETLAGNPIAVSLQGRAEPLALTLYWDLVAGAKGYRIYRSPTGAETIDGVRLIAEIDGGDVTSWEDDGTATPDANRPPRPLGSTGEWALMPELAAAREAVGVAAAQDPADPSVWHLYAVGGRDGAELDSVERLAVTLAGDGTQTVGAWAAGAPISAGRSELTAFSVSHSEAAQIPAGTTYLYAGGGAESSNVDAAQVAPGGELTWVAVDAMSPLRSGYAGIAGAGFLFAFGGAQSSPSDSNASSQLDPASVPNLLNWNNEGVRLTVPRYLAGGAEESAFIYIVGGMTTDGPTATVERTVL